MDVASNEAENEMNGKLCGRMSLIFTKSFCHKKIDDEC